jgi:hypothetical protein
MELSMIYWMTPYEEDNGSNISMVWYGSIYMFYWMSPDKEENRSNISMV